MKKIVKFTLIGIGILFILFASWVGYYAFTTLDDVFIVRGNAMSPTYVDGERLIGDFEYQNVNRGDIVSFLNSNPNLEDDEFLIKRVIGLPGETILISDGKVFVNDTVLDETEYLGKVATQGDLTITLLQDEYFVLGDNRGASFDSRSFGPIKKAQIKAKIIDQL